MNSLSSARRLSAVTFHTAEKAMSLPGAPSLGARFYQTRPSISGRDLLEPEKMVADFLRKQDLSAAADSLKFRYPEICADRKKWMACIEAVNASPVESPLRRMTGEQTLALLLTLSKAGHACRADWLFPEFAVLPLNLHALGQLSFPASDRSKLGQYARSCLDAVAAHLPCGIDFARSPKDLEVGMNRFMRQMLENAMGFGIGPREEDMGFPREISFDPNVPLGGGAFGVDRSTLQPVLLLSGQLLSDDLSRIVEEMASDNGMTPAQFADLLLVLHATTIAHEIVHAGQYSALSGVPADGEQFTRLQAIKYSLATEELVMGRGAQHQGPDDQFIFFPHEMPAWYVTGMGCAAFSQSTRMDQGVREAARTLISNPRNSRMMDELLGVEPRGFATLRDRNGDFILTSQPRVDKPEEYLRATPARLEAELDKVAPQEP